MPDAPRHRCAAESLARGEPLHGTASRVRRWLLLEQPGPWGRDALLESRLPRAVARALHGEARHHGVRPVLIRRPGWRAGAEAGRVYLVHSGVGRQWIEELQFREPEELLHIDLAAVASPDPPGLGRPGPDAVWLVCTNGRHDPCCADHGRPVVRALTEAGVAEVWESSHVGGDRFAANVVALPTGAYFGRVEPEEAAGLVADFAAGLIDLERYRGRCSIPPLVQSAEIFARRELQERRIDGLRVVRVDDTGPEAATVTLRAADGRRVEVAVARQRAEHVLLTCGSEGHPWRYVLVSLSVTS